MLLTTEVKPYSAPPFLFVEELRGAFLGEQTRAALLLRARRGRSMEQRHLRLVPRYPNRPYKSAHERMFNITSH